MPFSIRKFLAGLQVIPHQASFFGASLVNKLGGYDLDFGIAEDQEFMLRAALLREPITIRRVLCDFDTTGSEPIGPERCLQRSASHVGYAWSLSIRWPTSVARIPEVLGVLPERRRIRIRSNQSRRSESPRG